MTADAKGSSPWTNVLFVLRAIVVGLIVALLAANVWPALVLNLSVPIAAVAEAAFLSLYVWWVAGGGSPRSNQAARATDFRRGRLSAVQWYWAIAAALFFAATVHASIVLLFRVVPFPAAAFHRGYDFSFIPSLSLQWLAVVVSATSAGICEETGFRGYMQRPIEQRHGVFVAVLISSIFFAALHLSKGWAVPGMIPIVFGAGVLLGLIAWSSGSLIPGMIGHVAMDIGLFAYWWTGIAGTFTLRPIAETGIDQPFWIASAVLAISLSVVLLAISNLRQLRSAAIPE